MPILQRDFFVVACLFVCHSFSDGLLLFIFCVRLKMGQRWVLCSTSLTSILGRPSVPKPQHWGFLSVLTALSHSKETAFLSVVDLGWDSFLSLPCISRSIVCISASSWHKQVSFPSPMDRQLLLNPSLNGSYFCLGPGTGDGEQMGVLPLHG